MMSCNCFLLLHLQYALGMLKAVQSLHLHNLVCCLTPTFVPVLHVRIPAASNF